MFNRLPRFIWIVIGVSTLLRMVSAFLLDPVVFETGEIALNLYQDKGYLYTHNGAVNHDYQFPVHPYLLYGMYFIFGYHIKLGIVINILLVVFTAIFLYKLLQEICAEIRVPLIEKYKTTIIYLSVTAFLFHPFIFFYSVINVHSLCLDIFLFTVSLYFILSKHRSNVWLISIFISLAVLERPTFIVLLLIPFLKGRKWNSKVVWLPVFISVLTLTSWAYRNYLYTGRFELSSSMAQVLWVGNQEATSGTLNLSSGQDYYSLLPKEHRDSLFKMSTNEQSDFFMKKYRDELKTHPFNALKMYFIKIKNFWLYPLTQGSTYAKGYQGVAIIYRYYCVGLFVFFIVGFMFMLGKSRIGLIPFIFSLIHAVFYVETRHRMPVEALIIFIALVGLFAIIEYFKNRFRSVKNL